MPDDSTCYADINGDGVVDVLDLLLVISDWGACSGSCASDIDGNGAVDVLDLLEIIANWGPCPAVCEEGFVCGSGDDANDYICGESCYCFELADGSDSCVDIGTGNCGSFDICPDGTCPEGYGCVVSSCCEDPICVPFCD